MSFFSQKKQNIKRDPESASALILVLLITALLATIAVSFLSTARIEQTATRNYASKAQAEQFATSATQQAMAKIQQGFTVNGTGTGVVASQPGRLTKNFFQNGTCTQITTNLYTENGTQNADMNNLQNPGNITQIRGDNSANQTFTITGNASNRLIVNMENVTSNGTLIGRIAYYVDDELTKININAATANRTTLNVSAPRSLALTPFTSNNGSFTVSSSQVSLFQNLINGNGSSVGNMTNWGYIFRKEQLASSFTFNATGQQLANISTAPLSDFHLKYTPWGARRLHINDVPLNSTGVDDVYDALASDHLKNIYGQSFDGKYGQGWSWYGSNTSDTRILTAPVNGLKQIAANMLQMRSANTSNLTSGGYRFTGSVIGNNGSAFIPSTYFASAPHAVINEFAINCRYGEATNGMFIYIQPFVEIVAPMPNPYGGNASSSIDPSYCLQFTVKKLSLTIRDSLGATTTQINNNSGNWTFIYTQSSPGWSANKSVWGGMKWAITTTGSTFQFDRMNINGSPYWPYHPYEFSKPQINTFNNGNVPSFQNNQNLPWQIVGNVTFEMGDVKLYAGNTTSAQALVDWIPGSVINAMLGNGTTQADINGLNSGKINLPKPGPTPTSFQIKEPISGSLTGVLTKNTTTGAFISANITSPSFNGYWPFTPPNSVASAPYSRVITPYSSNATYTAALASFGLISPSVNLSVNNTATNTTREYIIANPKIYPAGNSYIANNSNDWISHVYATASANFGDINGMKDVSLQRVDPRVSGYGNSSTGYSSWVVAPNTFCKYTIAGNNTDIISNSYLYGNSSSSDLMAGHNTYNGSGFGDYGLRPSETSNRHIPGDPSPEGANEPDFYIANEARSIYFPQTLNTFDANGNATFNAPHDLGKVPTNVNWRRLRFMPRHSREYGQNLIPDWAMLDVISFSSNNSSSSTLKIAPINPNGAFAVDSALNNATYSRNSMVPALLSALSSNSAISTNSSTAFELGSSVANGTVAGSLTFGKDKLALNPYMTGNLAASPYNYFRGNFTSSTSTTLANNIVNRTWSTINGTWSSWRDAKGWPNTILVVPGEVTEISGVADYGARSQYDYSSTPGSRSIKENEGRLSVFFPGLTTCSNFFTIYAYAQAGKEINGTFVPDSEHLTKTMVEVEITTPATATTPAVYKVKSLYTQSIPMGD